MIKDIRFTQSPANKSTKEEDDAHSEKQFWCIIRFTQESDTKPLTAIGEGSKIVTALASAIADMQFLQEIH